MLRFGLYYITDTLFQSMLCGHFYDFLIFILITVGKQNLSISKKWDIACQYR